MPYDRWLLVKFPVCELDDLFEILPNVVHSPTWGAQPTGGIRQCSATEWKIMESETNFPQDYCA